MSSTDIFGGKIEKNPPESKLTEIFGVKIEKNPPESKLTELGVRSWPRWSCPVSKFPWSFTGRETIYVLEGRVKVNIEGCDGSFELEPRDFAVFPKGMKINCDCTEAFDKHMYLEENV
ncbi:RmlC-like cupins superfamily protein [Quillaja saponaria]|uniref:RmlC-like cupins superfamily protein n=1 Tax=Quillaja saponaria TaxID=32244 RepID=A0AAD7VKK0_QUISA|nr:RmlC-like cupins superfamily protein [Quillaja saponaria]KAJ7979296.1 RmlC-like cupins superfamily protein [Quillaja saponaria]